MSIDTICFILKSISIALVVIAWLLESHDNKTFCAILLILMTSVVEELHTKQSLPLGIIAFCTFCWMGYQFFIRYFYTFASKKEVVANFCQLFVLSLVFLRYIIYGCYCSPNYDFDGTVKIATLSLFIFGNIANIILMVVKLKNTPTPPPRD